MKLSGVSLAARGVSLAWGDKTVVRSVDVEFHAGRVTALVGPNGSGKSTLLRGMARLHPLKSGNVTLTEPHATSDIHRLAPRLCAQRIAMLTQHRPVPAGVTVREAVGFGRNPHRHRITRADPSGAGVVDGCLERCGLSNLADVTVDTFSGGQRQRVWLASCLAQQTPVLLLDEPTNHLDMRHQVELLQTLRELARDQGTAIGVVLHDLNQAAAVADTIALLHDGSVLATGTPSEVFTQSHIEQAYGVTAHVRDRAGRVDLDYLSTFTH